MKKLLFTALLALAFNLGNATENADLFKVDDQEINAEFQAAREKYNSEAPAKIGELNSFVEQGTARQQRVMDDERLSSSRTKLLNLIQYLLKTSTEIKEQLRLLRGKIQG